MQLSVREAAERVGVTRQTLFKKIKEGELSSTVDYKGNKQIDITELLRVYGELQSNDSQSSTTVNRSRQSKQSINTSDLHLELERSKMLLQMKDRELQLAQERIDELKSREAEFKQRDRDSTEERMRLLGVLETQNRLLAAPSPAKPVKPKVRPKLTTATKQPPTTRKQPVPAVKLKAAPTKTKTITKAAPKKITKK